MHVQDVFRAQALHQGGNTLDVYHHRSGCMRVNGVRVAMYAWVSRQLLLLVLPLHFPRPVHVAQPSADGSAWGGIHTDHLTDYLTVSTQRCGNADAAD